MSATQHPNSSSGHGGSHASTSAERPLWARLRPFVRRDLGLRVRAAIATVFAVVALAWLTAAGVMWSDSQRGYELRRTLGLESHPYGACGPDHDKRCTFDDEEQAVIDAAWAQETRLRRAVLDDLAVRLAAADENVSRAREILDSRAIAWSAHQWLGGDAELIALLSFAIDLQPLDDLDAVASMRSTGGLWSPLAMGDTSEFAPELQADFVRSQLEVRARELADLRALVADLHRANGDDPDATIPTVARAELFAEVFAPDEAQRNRLAAWVAQSGAATQAATSLRWALKSARSQLARASGSLGDEVWHDVRTGGRDFRWDEDSPVAIAALADGFAFSKPAERYRATASFSEVLRICGAMLLGIAALFVAVLSPVTTAISTAREREAGTLPVLRMTGLSAGDLALAMAIGPNAFNLVAGGALALLGVGMLGLSVPASSLLLPLALLVVFATAMHAIAIGLGDALGQRVNALVVGAILGVAVVVPGMFGALVAGFDGSATGLLAGPLPALTATIGGLVGLKGYGLHLDGQEGSLTSALLAASVAAHVLLALASVRTWTRRVEQPWAPLFRPVEGIVLAVMGVGCAALGLLELAQRMHVRDFAGLNALTFVAAGALAPVIVGLVIASLRRPERAAATIDHVEARRGFLRFQLVLVSVVALLGGAYALIMGVGDLHTEGTEIMWATLAQAVLALETAAAALLWAARRRDGRLLPIAIGSMLVMLQTVSVVVVHFLEANYVSRFSQAAMPLMLGSGVSSYWLAILVLLWAAGVAIVVAALMADRKESDGKGRVGQRDVDASEHETTGAERWLH